MSSSRKKFEMSPLEEEKTSLNSGKNLIGNGSTGLDIRAETVTTESVWEFLVLSWYESDKASRAVSDRFSTLLLLPLRVESDTNQIQKCICLYRHCWGQGWQVKHLSA